MALIVITFLFSSKKKNIDWGLVAKGTALQILIAILVLKVPFIEGGFHWISEKFVSLISYTDEGVDFLFGQMGIGVVQAPLITFAIKVLPTIIFFSALMSALYYLGVLQKVVYAFAWIMKKFMRLSRCGEFSGRRKCISRANGITSFGKALFVRNDKVGDDVFDDWWNGNHCRRSAGSLC